MEKQRTQLGDQCCWKDTNGRRDGKDGLQGSVLCNVWDVKVVRIKSKVVSSNYDLKLKSKTFVITYSSNETLLPPINHLSDDVKSKDAGQGFRHSLLSQTLQKLTFYLFFSVDV